jgi:hypothetical protein
LNSATGNIFTLNTKNPEAVIFLIDESLELNSGIQCDLLTGISDSECTFVLLDRKQNKFLALEVFKNPGVHGKSTAAWLTTIPEKSAILKNFRFKSISVEIINEQNTLVPSALFRKEDATKYFNFNFNKDWLVFTEAIPAFDAVNVFGVPQLLKETLNHLFDRYELHHHTTAWLEGIHLSFKKSPEKHLLVNIRNTHIDIAVTENKKLIFVNTFYYKSIDDLIYYVLSVCDCLQINPESVLTYLSGDVEKESAVYTILYKYIRNISFAKPSEILSFSYVFNDIPPHFYFNLFNLGLCES